MIDTERQWNKFVSREGVDLTTLYEADTAFYSLIWESTGQKGEIFFTTLKDKIFTHYSKIDTQKFGRFLYHKYLSDPVTIKILIKKGEKILAKSLKEAMECKNMLGENSKDKLILALRVLSRQFAPVNHIYSIMSFAAIEAWQNDFQDVWSRLTAREEIKDKLEEIKDVVWTPWRKTESMVLQEKVANGQPVSEMVKEFQFLRSWSLVWFHPIDKKWVESIKSKEPKRERNLLTINDVLKILNPNEADRWFIETSPYFIYFKDWRDELRRKHSYNWSFLFDAIADFLKVLRDDLGYLTLKEIEEALKTGIVDVELVSIRKENVCIVTSMADKLDMRVLSGESVKSYLDIISNLKSPEAEKDVKGFSAQKGIKTGRVRVISSINDVGIFKNGEVLIAKTTHPNYLSAMSKAVAIVTDEGGIASHAAITARELKIPCIVGTKIATRVLKDGDLVEVDAERGIVRILKKNNE